MRNVTLAIPEDLLAQARRYALSKGTTVNALIREHLARVISEQDQYAEARRELLELMRTSPARLGPDFRWNREELYDREALRRHQHPDLRGDGEERSA